MSDLLTLARWIKESRYTVALTGAGMSTESGLPDFRSPSGWWHNIDPRTVASVEALEADYPLFHQFYSARIRALADSKPHRGLLQGVATQNVDGFHQQANQQRVHELHGSIRKVRCHSCERQADVESFLTGQACPACAGRLRPGVVLFGETLPEGAWSQALTDLRSAELTVVVGTSLQVYPVAQLPSMTPGRVVMLNLERTEQDERFDLVLSGKAGELLQQLNSLL
ncbi:SIR2 family NAD-dependent protein deacylase [Tumebacillus lipolyticus]|uniref:protein acetyllysine N-acetyltransferase n=1 Tax=Tumebacillus lipolyticus TaxID=1280370 RepID=A0ABW5A0S5_9BACL